MDSRGGDERMANVKETLPYLLISWGSPGTQGKSDALEAGWQ